VVATPAATGSGLPALREAIRAALGDRGDDGAVLVTSARQHEALTEAADSLARAGEALAGGATGELAAVDLRVALDRLGRVTGESVDDVVLDALFARFCIGK
jgi:tRNA modification GTPase